MKGELNFYRKYCDHAAELMKDADEKAPFATEVLRKGLPILDRNLKELLEEIQEKAKTACQVSQGTLQKKLHALSEGSSKMGNRQSGRNDLASGKSNFYFRIKYSKNTEKSRYF